MECRECGWIFPEELMRQLNEGTPIYCEKCGMENFNQILKGEIPNKSVKVKKAFTSVKKKTIVFRDKVKQRLKEYREKHDNY